MGWSTMFMRPRCPPVLTLLINRNALRLPINRGLEESWGHHESVPATWALPWGLCKRTVFFRQHHRTENSQVWRSHMLGFKSWLYHLLALWSWVSLSLHICIVGIIIVTIQLVWSFNKYSLSTYSVPDLGAQPWEQICGPCHQRVLIN